MNNMLKRSDIITVTEISDKFLNIEYNLQQELRQLQFGPTIKYVYNPLEYAKEVHVNFIKKYYNSKLEKILFLGMNPGPWGMCQTGIPFGDSKIVKEWFSISGNVEKPKKEHPSKIITGLNCTRREGSGKKFWELMKQLCKTPENFFRHCIVHNICPLAFVSESGENLTPPQITAKNSKKLNELCDNALVDIIVELGIKQVIAIGKFAETRSLQALKKRNINDVKVSFIPHPSPRNVKYKADWENVTIQILKDLNVYSLLTEVDGTEPERKKALIR